MKTEEQRKFIWLVFWMVLFTFANAGIAAKRYGDETFRPGVVFILCGLYLIAFMYSNLVQPMFRQKKTRRSAIHTSSKVKDFKKLSNNIIQPKARKVKCTAQS